jgi:tetratricopeptide (TPR) repeat protein
MGLGQWDKALADFSRAIELNPKVPMAWNNRASAHFSLGQWEKALADSSRAIELDPNYALAWDKRGATHVELRQWDKALADCSRAIELNPKLITAWRSRGFAFTNLGQWDKAAADYAVLVELAPKDNRYWSALGELRYRAADCKGAVTALEKAVELGKGGSTINWLYLAMARWKLGDKDKAREWYDRAEKDRANDPALKALRAEAEALITKPK